MLLPKPTPAQASLGRVKLAFFLFTLTAVIFRSEMAILLFSHMTYMVLKRVARFGHLSHGVMLLKSAIIPAGIFGCFFALCVTIPVDTFFWQSSTYLWPEMSAFLSNIFPSDTSLGASAWGIQPWHWYFSSALPRLLMRPITYLGLWIVAVSTTATSELALDLLLPNLAYVAFYSLLPHKETRFIFPVVPPLTLAAALCASYIWTRRRRRSIYRLLSILLAVSTFVSALVAHGVLLPLSALSYPGAHALNALHHHVSSIQFRPEIISGRANHTVLVHLDNLSTQTGITRFRQHPLPRKAGDLHWIYDKSDNATQLLSPPWWMQFDYAIMESPQRAIGSWDVISTIHGLGSLRILHPADRTDEQRPPTVTGAPDTDLPHHGLDMVASQLYGPVGGWVSTTTRTCLRHGYGTRWLRGDKENEKEKKSSWTCGWWVDVDWLPKLYVLKKLPPPAEPAEPVQSH